MPKIVIERTIRGAGSLPAEQLKGISQAMCGELEGLGPRVRWEQSYVTDDKIYCVFVSPDEERIHEQATRELPAEPVRALPAMIDTVTTD